VLEPTCGRAVRNESEFLLALAVFAAWSDIRVAWDTVEQTSVEGQGKPVRDAGRRRRMWREKGAGPVRRPLIVDLLPGCAARRNEEIRQRYPLIEMHLNRLIAADPVDLLLRGRQAAQRFDENV
jgi:hypothetical protein